MDETIVDKLKQKDKSSNIFNILVDVMQKSNITFKDKRIFNSYGIATFDKIFLDVDKLLEDFSDSMVCFIVLHEIAHYKRIQKIGKDNMLKNLSSDNFDYLHKHLLEEEIFADRYASSLYYKLTGNLFPKNLTQELHAMHTAIS